MGEDFSKAIWGKTVAICTVDEDLMEMVRKGFSEGAVAEVLPDCRKDDNTGYSPEEMKDIEDGYEEQKKTINMPLCDTKGAAMIRNSFIKHFPHHGNDVEVGVYYSRTGGEKAQWHSDNNHNLTIQVLGEKTWSCAKGSTHTVRSKAKLDPPKNHSEQLEKSTYFNESNASQVTSYTLTPGTAFYIPPGWWHTVASVGRYDSFSIDLRIGNVLHAKWICEAVFSGLQERFHQVSHPSSAMGMQDYNNGVSDGLKRQMEYVAENIVNMAQSHPIPRALPSQWRLSNGFARVGTLEYLSDVLAPTMLGTSDTSRIQFTKNISVSFRTLPSALCLDFFFESTLSTMEYFRYTMHIPPTPEDREYVMQLVKDRSHTVSGFPLLASVLVYANLAVLVTEQPVEEKQAKKRARKNTK
eukprot:TRINITY_DN372_c1_g1_i1.p1 TRINITY_DN372_c1_g1~~TRINITY_DN372_c1_g1_i1.p1  ORF type:complete len:435 (+),score=108.39 TRINITY_DN372_c1_g1_i1:74-1306(+)